MCVYVYIYVCVCDVWFLRSQSPAGNGTTSTMNIHCYHVVGYLLLSCLSVSILCVSPVGLRVSVCVNACFALQECDASSYDVIFECVVAKRLTRCEFVFMFWRVDGLMC